MDKILLDLDFIEPDLDLSAGIRIIFREWLSMNGEVRFTDINDKNDYTIGYSAGMGFSY